HGETGYRRAGAGFRRKPACVGEPGLQAGPAGPGEARTVQAVDRTDGKRKRLTATARIPPGARPRAHSRPTVSRPAAGPRVPRLRPDRPNRAHGRAVTRLSGRPLRLRSSRI